MIKYFVRIFCPNGLGDECISIYAKEEFPDIKESNTFVQLKKGIIKCLQRLSPTELEENRLLTLVEIEHIKQNDFSNFSSIRFAYYALILAVFSMANIQTPLHELFHLSKPMFWNLVLLAFTIMLIIMSRTIHTQHDRLMYLNFKILCFEEMEKNKEAATMRVRKK